MYARIKSCVDMNKFRRLILASLLLSGCAQLTKPAPLKPATQVTPPAPVQAAQVVRTEPVLPNIELSDDLLYEMLMTEFASQRGHKMLALEESADVAQKTRDPRLAKRAAQMALESGDMNRAVAAFTLWQELDPDSMVAARMLSSLLLRGGKLDEARPYVVKVLKSEGANAGLTFLQLYPLVAHNPDHAAALKLMRDLAAPYPDVSEAHWLVAQLAQAAGDDTLALEEVRVARKLRPEWDTPVSLEASLLGKTAPQKSLSLLSEYLKDNPKAHDIRLQYARELLAQKQYKPARDEFELLAKETPDNVELAFAVALISLQLNDLPGAEAELRQSLGKDGKGQDAVAYFLGQLNEAKEDDAQALTYYRKVTAGEYLYAAQLRVVYLLNKQGHLDEAREVLRQIKATIDPQRSQLVIIEAQLLREVKRFDEAYRVLKQGLQKLPDDSELLYQAAMLADKLAHYEESEKLLHRLIKIKPDDAQAYNALGYGFLERNVRIAEAVTLVEKALQLSPGDHAIMDSVGWGYYRAGHLNRSVAMLRKAYAGNPDPEIAAHLGEVLWMRGDKEEAAKLWQDSLKTNPGNEPLQAVMKRFMP